MDLVVVVVVVVVGGRQDDKSNGPARLMNQLNRVRTPTHNRQI